MTIYTYTYKFNDGSTRSDVIKTVDSSSLPDPKVTLEFAYLYYEPIIRDTRPGYRFIGWTCYPAGDTQGSSIESRGILTSFKPMYTSNPRVEITSYIFFAQWEKDAYYESTTLDQKDQRTENRLVNRSLTKLPAPYLSGLKLEGDVYLNGLTLNTFEAPTDENGYADSVLWVCTDIEGWWTIPDPEIPDLTRGWGDGSYDAKGRYNSRLITLQGSILVQDPSDAPKARDTLIRALALVHTGGWLQVDEGPTKASYVRLSGAPKIESVNARGRINFSVGLKAADPIKYEWTTGSDDGYAYLDLPSSATSQVTITNSGNIAVPVVFEIRGGLANVDETDVALIRNVTSDQTITIVGPVTSSQTLEIDTYNREVLVVSNSGSDVVSGRPKTETLLDWIYLQPGDNKLSFYDSSASPSSAICRVYWRSGWIG